MCSNVAGRMTHVFVLLIQADFINLWKDTQLTERPAHIAVF